MSVGKESINRGLKLMNALLVALEQRGFKVTCPAGHSSDSYHRPDVKVEILSESFVFRLREKTRMIREEADMTGRPSSWESRTRYEPKDEFELSANRDRWGSLTWTDTKRRQLEDRLNDVIIELIVDVQRKRRYRERQKREAEERERAAELQRERERVEIEEARRRKFKRLTPAEVEMQLLLFVWIQSVPFPTRPTQSDRCRHRRAKSRLVPLFRR